MLAAFKTLSMGRRRGGVNALATTLHRRPPAPWEFQAPLGSVQTGAAKLLTLSVGKS